MMKEDQIEISVLIPVYNSEKILSKTVHKTTEELDKLNVRYEIILVNDGSVDKSWLVMRELKNQTPKQIKIINLLKNYGQHSAVLCAISKASGNYLVTMDDDLQNPPDQLEILYSKISEGYDLVFAKFGKKKHSFFRKLGSNFVGFLNSKIFNKPKHITLTNFRIFTSEVAKRVCQHKTFHPYIPGLLLMYSSNIANVKTEHHSREIGKSNYGIKQILKLVFRILFNYSNYPLNVAIILGLIVSLISFILSIFYIFKALFLGTNVEGWATVVVLISGSNAVILMIFGVMGQYITRMMNQISQPNAFQIKDEL